jgi:hypothetical protein
MMAPRAKRTALHNMRYSPRQYRGQLPLPAEQGRNRGLLKYMAMKSSRNTFDHFICYLGRYIRVVFLSWC